MGLDFGLSAVSVFGCAGGGPVARGLGAGAAGALAAGLLAGGGSAGAGAGGLGAGAVYLGVASISRGLTCCACSCACCSCSACHCSACHCSPGKSWCSCCACQCVFVCQCCHCCCCHCCCCAGYPPSCCCCCCLLLLLLLPRGLATPPPPPGNLCLSQRKKNKTGRSFIYYEYAAERSLAATFNAFRCSSIMKMQPNEAWLRHSRASCSRSKPDCDIVYKTPSLASRSSAAANRASRTPPGISAKSMESRPAQ